MRKIVKDSPIKGLSFLYNTILGRFILKLVASNGILSNCVGYFMDTPISKIMIRPFIKNNHIDMNDYEKVKYKNFNDFFTREIKKENRVIIKDDNSFIAPCDSKLTYYKITKDLTFNVKKSIYSVSSIIQDDIISKSFTDGYALVFRLSPDDYHHYCFNDEGRIISTYKIKGKFHTVNPIVYDKFEVFKENTRECTIIKTNNFDNIMYVEVGALLVGKIKNLKTSGKVNKGQKKGYFMYGGSTVVIFIKKNMLVIDEDIIKNSKNGFETVVHYGEKIGEKYE